MPNYNFSKDLPIALATEREIAFNLESFYGYRILELNANTKYYDLLIETSKGIELKIEVKEDFTCERTGNVGVEFKCRGKPSGIFVTEAQYYIYKIHTPFGIKFYMLRTEKLKEMITKHLYKRIIIGGDRDSGSMNYLFDLEVFKRNAIRIFC